MFLNKDDRRKDIASIKNLIEIYREVMSALISQFDFNDKNIENLAQNAWDTESIPSINKLNEKLDSPFYYKKLKKVGLTGIQLELKSSVLKSKLGLDENKPKENNYVDNIIRNYLKIFFDFFNSILGSLGMVIIYADALKEFKDIIHIYHENK